MFLYTRDKVVSEIYLIIMLHIAYNIFTIQLHFYFAGEVLRGDRIVNTPYEVTFV